MNHDHICLKTSLHLCYNNMHSPFTSFQQKPVAAQLPPSPSPPCRTKSEKQCHHFALCHAPSTLTVSSPKRWFLYEWRGGLCTFFFISCDHNGHLLSKDNFTTLTQWILMDSDFADSSVPLHITSILVLFMIVWFRKYYPPFRALGCDCVYAAGTPMYDVLMITASTCIA